MSGDEPVERALPRALPSVAGPPRAWRTAVRTAAFGWVELLARKAYVALGARTLRSDYALAVALAPYFGEHGSIATDADARSSAYFTLIEEPGRWVVHQRLSDPEGDGDWRFTATVDLAQANEAGAPTLSLQSIGRFGEEVDLAPMRAG